MKTELAARVDPPPDASDWLGFAPAAEGDIAALEQMLGLILPPSYRAFLLTSNGWRRTTPFIERIRPAQEVNLFSIENEHWVDAYSQDDMPTTDTEYYCYDENGAPGSRTKHMQSLIQVSDVDDGVYLLNPDAVTPDGEWEAWFFANWVPGAVRFPSFAHLMLDEYRSFARLMHVDDDSRELPVLKTFASDVPRLRARRVGKKILRRRRSKY